MTRTHYYSLLLLAIALTIGGAQNVDAQVFFQDFNDGGAPVSCIADVAYDGTPGDPLTCADLDGISTYNGKIKTPGVSGTGTDYYIENGTGPVSNDGIMWGTVTAVAVNPGSAYRFSFYGKRLNGANPTKIRPRINGATLDPDTYLKDGLTYSHGTSFPNTFVLGDSPVSTNWIVYSADWCSSGDDLAQLTLHDATNTSQGNDSGIDDISLTEIDPTFCNYRDYGDAGNIGTVDYSTLTLSSGTPAGHEGLGAFLGTRRDLESDGLPSANLSGDDDAGEDDEDGVAFTFTDGTGATAGLLPPGAHVMTVVASGSGFLQAWVDAGASGPDGVFQASEQVVTDLELVAGSNLVSFTVPTEAAPVAAAMRFRFSSGTGVGPTGIEPDGEVEDYLVTVGPLTGDIAIELPASVSSLGLNGSGLLDLGSLGAIDPSGITSLTVNTGPEDDQISLDWDLVQLFGGPDALTINLGDGFDTLTINHGGATPDVIVHTHASATSGTIEDDLGHTLTYTGADPIADNMIVSTRVFTFTGGTETIVLNADGDGATGNGYSYIDSDLAENVAFANPTVSLTINAGTGEDSVTIGALDTPIAGTFTGIWVNGHSDGTADDAEDDTFFVTPSSYPISIDGEDPAGTCPGDGLRLDLSGGAVVDVFTLAGGAGSYTFTTGELPVTFSDIEAVGDTDLSIEANYETLYATQDLTTATGNELVLTITNTGAFEANCVTVTLSDALADWLDGEAAVEAPGTLAGTTWTVGTIGAGDEATLTITGFVAPPFMQDVSFTLDAFQDTTSDDNVATIELSLGFVQPPKTHVNAAHYYSKSVSGGGSHDALIVGLFQGAPGIEGAVWCKIPDTAAGTSWPAVAGLAAGNHFRPCSEGLPFPLHVNDVFEDVSGTLWLATWGSDGLYVSEDDGESWSPVEAPLGPKGEWVTVYAITEDASGVLYASANNGLVYRSINGGAAWQQVGSLPGVSSDTPWSLTAHPFTAGTLYAGTFGGGVFVSIDFGFTWEELDNSATATVSENDALLDLDGSGDDFAGHIFDLEFSPDNDCGTGNDDCDLYAGTGNGVWRANIGSGTIDWTLMGPDLDPGADVVLPEVRTLAFVDNSPGADPAIPAEDDDLVIGTWGSGAFIDLNPARFPITGDAFAEVTLRGSEIRFVAVSPSGAILLGTSTGLLTEVPTVSASTSTASEPDATVELPEGYSLGQNYPNPFNPVTTIGFALPETGQARLSVFDALGREVAILVNGLIEAGEHEVQFSATDLPTGTYLYRLSTQAGAMSRTLVLMK